MASGHGWDPLWLAQPAWALELGQAWKSVWVPESDCALEPACLLDEEGWTASDILELLHLASEVEGIWEGDLAVTADCLPSPGWASESDSSLEPAWGAGHWEALGGRAREQGWGLSLDPMAVWLWLPARGRGLGDCWPVELAWGLSASDLVDLAWSPELAGPPELLLMSPEGWVMGVVTVS